MTTIHEYYKMKEIQEKKFRTIRNTIFALTPSMKERRELLKKKNVKCVKCKKIGGQRFFSTYDTLNAECNAIKKCDFNIKLKKTHTKYISDLHLHDKINTYKEKLIEIKTKNLFRLATDDETITEMEKIIQLLDESTLLYNELNKPNTKDDLKKTQEALDQIINEMKEKTASEAIEMYTTILKETLEELRKIKYKSMDVYPEQCCSLPHGIEKAHVLLLHDDIKTYTIDIKSV